MEFLKMKKIFVLVFTVLLLSSPIFAEKTYTLDKAISQMAASLAEKLPLNTKVVVVEIKAEKPEVSDYIVEELTADLLGTGKLVVVDRQNLDKIREELSFQVSGDVSDDSAQKLGAMLGAETLVSGTFELLNGKYRMVIKAVKVETSEIQFLSTLYVSRCAETETLFGQKKAPTSTAFKIGNVARNVLDFSGRFICMSVNPIFGIGSGIQGDKDGKRIVALGELAGGGTLLVGLYRREKSLSGGVLITTVGGGVLGLSVVYSLIRPWTYNRAPKVTEILDNVDFTSSSGKDLSVGYTVRY